MTGKPYTYTVDVFDENGKYVEDPYLLLGGLEYNKALYHCQIQKYDAVKLINEETGEEVYFKAIFFGDDTVHYLPLNFKDFILHINRSNRI